MHKPIGMKDQSKEFFTSTSGPPNVLNVSENICLLSGPLLFDFLKLINFLIVLQFVYSWVENKICLIDKIIMS